MKYLFATMPIVTDENYYIGVPFMDMTILD